MLGVEIDIVGAPDEFIVGIEGVESGMLITGTETGALFTWVEGVSGS